MQRLSEVLKVCLERKRFANDFRNMDNHEPLERKSEERKKKNEIFVGVLPP